MLLYYAMGGGLGHLTRARAFLHTLGLEREATLFTSSRLAGPRVTGSLPVVRVPAELDGDREGLRALLDRTIADLAVRHLVVDAFPAGLLGELAEWKPPSGVALWHVARLLRWERYVSDAGARRPRADVSFVLEELHDEHRRALEGSSAEIRSLALVDPPFPPPAPVAGPYVLVVHGGPDEETSDLVACARELSGTAGAAGAARVVLASPTPPEGLPPDVTWVDAYPAAGLFAGAERIVTAAGFNAVRQTEPFRAKRFLVPYPRRFDDQFTRAARATRET